MGWYHMSTETNMQLPAAIEVAREFFALAKEEESPNFTNMKLMKLLFRSQALSLHERDRKLFRDAVKAWKDGPVVPSVFHENKGVKVIPFDHAALSRPAQLGSDDRELVHAVWTRYKRMTGDQMSDATHRETAWEKAWARSSMLNRSPTISEADMRADVEADRQVQAALFDAYVAGLRAGDHEPNQTGRDLVG